MEFSKIQAPSLKELFITQLEHMILSGKLPIGEKLPSERELAQTMQVSRAVVNNGITELSRKGFLTVIPRIGTIVADYRKNGTAETLMSIMAYNGGRLRKAEIRSILELRIALDTLVINLCIDTISQTDLLMLEQIVEKIKTSSNPTEASKAAFEFQHELACLSGNTLIPLIFHSFQPPILSLWERFCHLYGIETLYENTSIFFGHIKAREREKAVAWIETSIQETIAGKKQIYY